MATLTPGNANKLDTPVSPRIIRTPTSERQAESPKETLKARRKAVLTFLHHNTVPDFVTELQAKRDLILESTPHQGQVLSHIIRCPEPSLQTLNSADDAFYLKISLIRAESPLAGQVIKDDHFGGLHSLPEPPEFEGAPNFRRSKAKEGVEEGKGKVQERRSHIYGVAQPSIQAAQRIIASVLSDPSIDSLLWVNLREEPVVYINGASFSARDPKTLNVNLDHLIGIEREDLETMEQRLKADIVADARTSEGCFDILREGEDMINKTDLEMVSSGSLLTPLEVFSQFRHSGCVVSYFRIPITDECAPEEKDFDAFVQALRFRPTSTAFIFNCQMGKGRTTTGMVIGHLLKSAEQDPSHTKWKQRNTSLTPHDPSSPNYVNGEFECIMCLVARFADGELIKLHVDQIVDNCDALVNLRTCIQDCKARMDACEADDMDRREQLRTRGMNYLERYWWIIAFNAYLWQQAPQHFSLTFEDWMRSRWGLRKLMRKIDQDVFWSL